MTKLTEIRARKLQDQDGHCWYCSAPIWTGCPEDFRAKHRLTQKQADLLQCTAEHLVARCDGGKDDAENIVAACKFCNQRRHKRKVPPGPVEFREHVRARVAANRWTAVLFKRRRTTAWPPHLEHRTEKTELTNGSPAP